MLRRLGALCLQRLGEQHPGCCCAALPGAAAIWPAQLQSLSALAAAASNGGAQALHSSAVAAQEFVSLNNISDNPGATKTGRRLGRGVGSSKGKTAGRGHKGQKARSGRNPRPGFEGGQTPLRLRVPKKGFHNPFTRWWQPINLDRLQHWVAAGRLDASRVVTMKDLRDSGAVHKNCKDGVKLLATGASRFRTPLHLQVSQASAAARAAVAAAGGSVTTVYYNKLGLRALLDPDWFAKKGRLLPRPARAPPKLEGRFDVRGSLPPDLSLPRGAGPAAAVAVAGAETSAA